ncbi:MAG: UvrB/UvrC motif-containing protein [Opitutales bacterium]|nr:UvrB/UvrC motif-containing protein [Opitutales bacterium]
MEYKCDICGAPATVHITKIVNGQKIKMHLCQNCAQKNAELCSPWFPADIFPQIKKLEEKILDIASAAANPPEANAQACPKCGSTFAEFEKNGRFSCPECYKAFGGRVLQILAQMHGAVKHIGKTPKTHSKKSKKGDERQTELQFPQDDCGGLDIEKLAEETLAKIIGSKQKPSAAKQGSPKDELQQLKSELEKAVKEERYEDAASLRDKINSLESKK